MFPHEMAGIDLWISSQLEPINMLTTGKPQAPIWCKNDWWLGKRSIFFSLKIKMDFNSLLYRDNLGMAGLIKHHVHQSWSETNIAVCMPATTLTWWNFTRVPPVPRGKEHSGGGGAVALDQRQARGRTVPGSIPWLATQAIPVKVKSVFTFTIAEKRSAHAYVHWLKAGWMLVIGGAYGLIWLQFLFNGKHE